AVAQELSLLLVVVRAAPVPRALPPLAVIAVSPLTEPLVGTTDQVVVDPQTGLEHQWYLFRCHVDEAWRESRGAGVVLADIDWGFRVTHEDLASRLDLAHAHNACDGGSDVS